MTDRNEWDDPDSVTSDTDAETMDPLGSIFVFMGALGVASAVPMSAIGPVSPFAIQASAVMATVGVFIVLLR